MADRNASFGINMMSYCRDHEKYINEGLERGMDPARLLKVHQAVLHNVQHERLVHWLVTMFTGIIVLVVIILNFLMQHVGLLIALTGFIILLFFYLLHYFRLENTVQRWYAIEKMLMKKCS